MQPYRTDDGALSLDGDPASDRLKREDVIAIHRAHMAGVAWNTIAAQYNTTRKNVMRIVQGRRHRKLHPKLAPELYGPVEAPALAVDPLVDVVDSALMDARERILRELRDVA